MLGDSLTALGLLGKREGQRQVLSPPVVQYLGFFLPSLWSREMLRLRSNGKEARGKGPWAELKTPGYVILSTTTRWAFRGTWPESTFKYAVCEAQRGEGSPPGTHSRAAALALR